MVATNRCTVTVFGGTGFLGRRIVRHLRSRGFPGSDRVKASGSGHRLFGPDDPQLKSVGANIHDKRSVADALAGAHGVVNAVSLYVELSTRPSMRNAHNSHHGALDLSQTHTSWR